MKDQDFADVPDLSAAMEKAVQRAGVGNVQIDVEKYQAYLDDPSLSDAQKEEIIHALWTIIVTFVELGFGVHPVQQACGQLENERDPAEQPDSDVIKSDEHSLKTAFEKTPRQD